MSHHNGSRDMLVTAWFLKTVSKWFNLVASRCRVLALSFHDMDKYMAARNFLEECIHLFKSLTVGKREAWKPVQTGVILTTNSVLDAADTLLTTGFHYTLTSRFSTDCIENLFSCVRSNNPVPTPLEFKSRLCLISVAQFMQVKSSTSYDLDDGSFVSDFLA